MLAEQAGKQPRDLGIALAHDMRLSSPELAERYKTGLMGEGVHVMDAGEAATEVLYWLVGARGLDGGLVCTASHNPAKYTGAKLVGVVRCRFRAMRASTRSVEGRGRSRAGTGRRQPGARRVAPRLR